MTNHISSEDETVSRETITYMVELAPHTSPNECNGTLSADDGNDDDDDTVIPTMMQSLKPVRDTSSTDTLSTTTTTMFYSLSTLF